MEPRACGNTLQRARIGLRSDAVDRVLALHFGEFVVEILAHLRRDAVRIERRIVDGEARRAGRLALERLAGTAIHAARIAAEQEADLVVRTVALVNANFLALALRQVDQLGGNGQSARLFEQRAELAAQRTAGNIRAPERILDDGIVGAADFERAFARADVQSGFAVQLAFEDQLADQFQFGLRGMRTHAFLVVALFVVSDDGFEQISEPFVAARVRSCE